MPWYMLTGRSVIARLAFLLLLATPACGLAEARPVTTDELPVTCPVTIPSSPGLVPPGQYSPQPSVDGTVWYGTADLWTVLPIDGSYQHRKSVWWSRHFKGGREEPRPEIEVKWRRLDSKAAPITAGPHGTNAFTVEDGWFMIAGIDPDTAGCWEVTAAYRDAVLSYVYLISR